MTAGMPNFRLAWHGAAVLKFMERAAHLGVKSAGEELLERSLAVVPRFTDALANSATVDAKGSEAVVSYTSPYAVKQHEDQRLKHSAGKQAKYLQGPLEQGQGELKGKMGTTMRNELPKGTWLK